MAWLRKKSKPRRVPSERSRPVKGKPFFPSAPPEKRVGRFLISAGLLLCTVALVAQREESLDIRVGQQAQRDYRARIAFDAEDPEATRNARTKAERNTPYVFRNDVALLTEIAPAAIRFLEKLQKLPRNDRPSVMAEGRKLWKLSDADLRALKAGLKPGYLSVLRKELAGVLQKAARRGLIAEEDADKAEESPGQKISVYASNKQQLETRSYDSPIPYPDDLHDLRWEIETKLLDIDDTVSAKGHKFGEMPDAFRESLLNLLVSRAQPTLSFDRARTEGAEAQARRNTAAVVKPTRKGALILRKGEVATDQVVRELNAERRAYLESRRPSLTMGLRRLLGNTLGVLLVCVICGLYIGKRRSDIMRSNTRLFSLGVISLVVLGVARLSPQTSLLLLLSPVALAGMVLAVGYGQSFAAGITVAIAFLLALMLRSNFSPVLILAAGGVVAVFACGRLRRRTDLIGAGLIAGAAQFVATWALGLAEAGGPMVLSILSRNSVAALANGVAAGFVFAGALPFVEKLFGVVTDMSLLEWSDQNQPLMRKLVLEAPGTYHHSMIVGNLAEAAAAAIGANPLLARVSGFLHDVGKLNKPGYFVENTENKPSRHEGLSPTMSTLIITAHTKDGVELARRYSLPKPVVDIIEQHHGTCVVEYFYNRALSSAPENESLDKDVFRYRGPKPRTREAGIVMLADAAESASRTLRDPTPARIEGLVKGLADTRLMDAQLADTPLTLSDVRRIEESLTRALIAMFHHRIRYPKRVQPE